MRTTIDIPDNLLEEAMALTNAKTKNQLIKEVLESYIARIKRQRLIALKGTLDLDIDLDTLRDSSAWIQYFNVGLFRQVRKRTPCSKTSL